MRGSRAASGAVVLAAIGSLLAAPSVRAAPSAAPAAASPAALQLEWSAPAGCPDVAEVRVLAAGLLGRSLGPGGAGATVVRARVLPADRGFVLTIETRSASGTDTRQLRDPRCSVLAEAAALIAATAVDPSLALRTGGSAQGLSPETGPELVPPAPDVPVLPDMPPGTDAEVATVGPTPPAPEVEEPAVLPPTGADRPAPIREPAPLRVALRLAGLADLGGTPGPTAGVGWTAALLGRLWRAELAGLWLAPRVSRPDPDRSIGARVGLLAGALRGCLTPRVGRVEVPACAGLEVGALRGQGVGAEVRAGAADVLPWVAVQVGPGLIFAPIPRLAVTLQVDLVVPVLGARFNVGEYGEVYRGGAAAGRAALGFEVRFR